MMIEHQHVEGCLFCAVRQMTEGAPRPVLLEEAGDSVTGIVIWRGWIRSDFAVSRYEQMVPVVDMWTGTERVRFIAYSASAQREVRHTEPLVGDVWTITFEEWATLQKGRFAGRQYRRYTSEVKRGHH